MLKHYHLVTQEGLWTPPPGPKGPGLFLFSLNLDLYLIDKNLDSLGSK